MDVVKNLYSNCLVSEMYIHTCNHSGTLFQQISFSVSDQVSPGILDPQQMMDYQTVTNLRVRLVNPFANLGVNESYIYYAIYEWSIQGTCLCNGHGECSPLPGEELVDGKVGLYVCICTNNMPGTTFKSTALFLLYMIHGSNRT